MLKRCLSKLKNFYLFIYFFIYFFNYLFFIFYFSTIISGRNTSLQVTSQHIYRFQQLLDKCQEEMNRALLFFDNIITKNNEIMNTNINNDDDNNDTDNNITVLEIVLTSKEVINYIKGLNEIKLVSNRVISTYNENPKKFDNMTNATLPSIIFLIEQLNEKWNSLLNKFKTVNNIKSIFFLIN